MLVLASCMFYFYYKAGRFSNTYAELKDNMELRNEKIQRLDSGRWYLNKWMMYHTLSFEPDNNIVVNNSADTIYHYKYMLKGNTLWLVTNEKDSIPNKIKLHNNNELLFESFLNEKKELRYSRINKMQK